MGKLRTLQHFETLICFNEASCGIHLNQNWLRRVHARPSTCRQIAATWLVKKGRWSCKQHVRLRIRGEKKNSLGERPVITWSTQKRLVKKRWTHLLGNTPSASHVRSFWIENDSLKANNIGEMRVRFTRKRGRNNNLLSKHHLTIPGNRRLGRTPSYHVVTN